MVILGTQYAGEMKKGIFSVMHYLMPRRGVLSLHSGCNIGQDGDVSLFFGLSGGGMPCGPPPPCWMQPSLCLCHVPHRCSLCTLGHDLLAKAYLLAILSAAGRRRSFAVIEQCARIQCQYCCRLMSNVKMVTAPKPPSYQQNPASAGTGKTTLSTDPQRPLIGDDEHCWSDNGVFNIEGGCYAKCIGLKKVRALLVWSAVPGDGT